MSASPSELLRRHGLVARKRFGQNFLLAPNVHGKIAAASGAGDNDRIIEIGAGLGTLTQHLLATGAEVWAIERDRDLCHVLRHELAEAQRFRLFEGDALKFDYRGALEGVYGRPIVVGNIPYNITGPLLFRLLEDTDVLGRWILMLQKEVADRLCASPGSHSYGAPTITLSRLRDITRICTVPPGAFVPAPKISSAVVRFEPRAQPRGVPVDPHGFSQLVRAAFRARRKTMQNALAGLASRERVLGWCELANVDPGVRPERVSVEQFTALQRAREHTHA